MTRDRHKDAAELNGALRKIRHLWNKARAWWPRGRQVQVRGGELERRRGRNRRRVAAEDEGVPPMEEVSVDAENQMKGGG